MTSDILVIGSCSLCDGPVLMGRRNYDIATQGYPPVPKCRDCGAIKKHPWGEVVEMVPAQTKTPKTANDIIIAACRLQPPAK